MAKVRLQFTAEQRTKLGIDKEGGDGTVYLLSEPLVFSGFDECLTLTWRIVSQAFFDSSHRDLQGQKITLGENQSIKNRLWGRGIEPALYCAMITIM